MHALNPEGVVHPSAHAGEDVVGESRLYVIDPLVADIGDVQRVAFSPPLLEAPNRVNEAESAMVVTIGVSRSTDVLRALLAEGGIGVNRGLHS